MLAVTFDGCDVGGMGEFDAEEKESRKPNEGLHGVVEAERERRRRPPESTNVCGFVLDPKKYISQLCNQSHLPKEDSRNTRSTDRRGDCRMRSSCRPLYRRRRGMDMNSNWSQIIQGRNRDETWTCGRSVREEHQQARLLGSS